MSVAFGGTVSIKVMYLLFSKLSMKKSYYSQAVWKIMFCNCIIFHMNFLNLFSRWEVPTSVNSNPLQAIFSCVYRVIPDDMEYIQFWIYSKLSGVSQNLYLIDWMRGLFNLWLGELHKCERWVGCYNFCRHAVCWIMTFCVYVTALED